VLIRFYKTLELVVIVSQYYRSRWRLCGIKPRKLVKPLHSISVTKAAQQTDGENDDYECEKQQQHKEGYEIIRREEHLQS